MLTFLALFIGVVELTPMIWHRWGPDLTFNYTESEPIGFYLLRPLRHPKRGMIVELAVPARVRYLVYGRRWLQYGWPMLKGIGALPGDRYCVTDHAVFINGKRRGPISTVDTQGLPLPKLRGCFTVPAGQFLPFSDHSPKSFDGRYFGTVGLSQVRDEVRPLWTF
ncbi:MAG TPA: S26 family signal peptidase [Gammaproteobacteria bacterium]|nr:S26 family signal peptidase [Gammaproteobacteria bacterium]